MDDQIMNSSKDTTNDEATSYTEIDISNNTLLAEWIKDKLLFSCFILFDLY